MINAKSFGEKPFLVLVLLYILVSQVWALKNLGPTYDEWKHLKYGYRILNFNSDRFNDSEMPFSFLNALSCRVGQIVRTGHLETAEPSVNDPQVLKDARLATIVFSLLLAFFIFRWTKELYGLPAAFFALILYAYSPNLLAHAELITADLYAVSMVTIATYYFWRCLKYGGRWNFLASAVALGVAQLAKYSCIYLYPIFWAIAVARYGGDFIRRPGRFLKYGLVALLINIFIINAGFLFNKTGTPLKDYHFRSDVFKGVQSKLRWFEHWPIPLPHPYLEGLDWVRHTERTGEGYGNIYLLGQLKEKGPDFDGFKGYYFIASLFKEPIAIQLFVIFAFVSYWAGRAKRQFWKNEAFLLIPVLFYAAYFNFLYKGQIGIRHFLVVVPLLIIFTGNFFKHWPAFDLKRKRVVLCLFAYLAVSVSSYFPLYLTYFNEFAWDRKQGYKILADSNLDWGQSGWYLGEYLRSHPGSVLEPPAPMAGRIVVCANALVGVFEPQKYKWLRENFQPIDHVAHACLVYSVTEEDLQRIK